MSLRPPFSFALVIIQIYYFIHRMNTKSKNRQKMSFQYFKEKMFEYPELESYKDNTRFCPSFIKFLLYVSQKIFDSSNDMYNS